MNWKDRLDGRLARALMSIQSVKGVEIGANAWRMDTTGREYSDPIRHGKDGIHRTQNEAGGLEGGMTNGEDIVLGVGMKPIPTTKPPAPSVDLKTGKEAVREWERSDVCAVPAGAIIAEAVVSFEILRAYVEKFGGDTINELQANLGVYKKNCEDF